MNRWNIPDWLEKEVIERDTHCVYCGIEFNSSGSRKSKASWEHIINDEKIITRENIVLCCISCNSSKGSKLLADWITSTYCKSKNITPWSVADVIKQALNINEI
ncbi:MAG: HNH endonuclease [Methylophilaceae bacterium]|nr:HNH endonuclease [Methylophilaceae bacterium]